jgi:hypothetical protein
MKRGSFFPVVAFFRSDDAEPEELIEDEDETYGSFVTSAC